MRLVLLSQRIPRQIAVAAVLSGQIPAKAIRVPNRSQPCPSCGVSAWFGARAFEGEPVSYYLCKWCGFRTDVDEDLDGGTLAIPVFHECVPGQYVLTWHQFEGEPYAEKYWTCDCGAELRVMETLRPYPRFATDPSLVEPPGK